MTSPNAARVSPWGWLALLAASVATYFFGLGSPFAPTNGDEMVYIHIARLTALSDHWLPLVSDLANMRNTKPPLLFWQAMVAGDWGQNWSLFALRLPSVVYTLLTTGLIAVVTRRITGNLRTALLAGVLYLLFFSTFRYGRVYLTSGPETFWFCLPLFWLLWLQADQPRNNGPVTLGRGAFTAMGIAMGLGMAYKSFALVAPAAAALWCAMVWRSPLPAWRDTLRSTVGVGWSATVALALFAVWFALDPDPGAVWKEFVVGENAGKMSGEHGYWHAALFGQYPLWSQLLAYPENAGLLSLLVIGWAGTEARAWLKRPNSERVAPTTRILWIWLLVWLVVFSLPSQRSARYVIPAMPVVAILMAMSWDKVARPWLWATWLLVIPALGVMARVGWVMGEMQIASGIQVAMTLVAACAGAASVVAGFLIKSWAKNATLTSCLAVYVTFGVMTAPLSGAEAGYDYSVQKAMKGQRVAVPNGFTGQYERFHFVLPHSAVVPYDAEGRNTGAHKPDLPPDERLTYLLDTFDAVVWLQDRPDRMQPSCLPQCAVLGSRWHVKSRHKSGEVTLANVWQPQEWLFRREWLLKKLPASSATP
jgi:4-amino-4-deoxy-L-arabinose transferase-like glycosyltransferase